MSKTLTPAQKNGTESLIEAPVENGVAIGPSDQAATLPSELPEIPYLGETRRVALALAGLRTLDDLRAASVEQIAAVKGIGKANATRVKEWLGIQAEMPAVAAATPIPQTETSASALAAANQDVQEVFQKLGSASERLKKIIPSKPRDKMLNRQLDKLDTVASELAEGPDTLSMKQMQEAVKTLDKIAALLETAAAAEKLTPKKQTVLIEELRARRKRLQKALGE